MIQKILCLTDFSEASAHAADTAIALAGKTGAQLLFGHGMVMGMNWEVLDTETRARFPYLNQQAGEAKVNLSRLVREAQSQGIHAEFELRFADGQRNLVAQLTQGGYDLLVMGAQGQGERTAPTIGASATKVLRTVQHPVLVAHRPLDKPLNLQTVVFATGMEPDTETAFETLLDFSKQFGSRNLHLLVVTTPNNFQPTGKVMATMRRFVQARESDHIHLHNYNDYSVEAGTLAFANEIGADLLAIANHGRNDLTGLFIESIPENLVKYGDLPVLSIRV